MTEINPVSHRPDRSSILIEFFLITFMMSTATISIVHLMQRIISGWDGSYVVLLVALITIERLATFSKVQSFELEQKIIYHFAELITVAILLKLMTYLLHGFGQFFDDIANWQRNFLTFFTAEYLTVLLLLVASWIIAGIFAQHLEELRIDKLDYKWDVGILENRRQDARSAMINLIFAISVAMILASILTRLDVSALMGDSPALQIPVINILLFFLSAFLFFSHTQFSLLNGRWMWHQAVIQENMTKSWMRLGLIFLAAVSIISFILPTSYTFNFLELIRIAITVVTQILFFLFTLFFLPIGWLFSLLKGSEIQTESPPPPDFSLITPPRTDQPLDPILVFLQSLLFWVVFLGLIIISFTIYFRQNQFPVSSILKIGLLSSIKRWFVSLWMWLSHKKKSLTTSIRAWRDQTARLFQTQSQENAVKAPFLSGRSPRQVVIHGFIRLVESAKSSGIDRKPYQTASQFSQTLQGNLPEFPEEIRGLTETFEKARYSQQEITRKDESTFDRLRKKVVDTLEKLKSSTINRDE